MGSLPQYIWGHYVAFLGCVECISSEKETLKVLRVPTRKENRTIAVKGQIILCASLIFQTINLCSDEFMFFKIVSNVYYVFIEDLYM